MKKLTSKLQWIIAVLIVFFYSSCTAIGDIFKAGMWCGIILVVGFIILIIWIISKVTGGGKNS